MRIERDIYYTTIHNKAKPDADVVDAIYIVAS